ncbi:MAG: beta-lactamase family protein [Bacteroidetes bacterium]|nr:beta-lactamase family protein [Bacteroidota bacterium]
MKKFVVYFSLLLLTVTYSFAQYDFSEASSYLKEHRGDLGGNVAALIWKDGKIIYQEQIGNMDTNKITPIASCSKWLTAALAMTFVDEGKISLEDSIGKFLPLFSQYGKGHIKIKHCLSHTTGIESEPLNLFTILHENSYSSLETQVDDIARKKKLIATPGTEFRYSNIGLSIVARILEVISNKSFEELFQERIAIPLGMTNTSFGKGKLVSPSGGARSTADDYMHFLVMILNNGNYDGKQIISETSIQKMQEAQTILTAIKYAPKGAEGFNYALGEWVQEADKNGKSIVLTSPGFFGTWPYVDNCRKYAALFFVKKFFISEKTKAIYLQLKKIIDNQIIPVCE